MKLSGLSCAGCGHDDLASIRPGHDAVYEHPRDMFGMPDLRQKPVMARPGEAATALCAACLHAAFPALNRTEAAIGV